MEISNQTGFTFRQLIYERKAIPEELWHAFWSGEFECRGKCHVTIEFPPEVRPGGHSGSCNSSVRVMGSGSDT